jgi:hypothetical protein
MAINISHETENSISWYEKNNTSAAGTVPPAEAV